MTDIVLVDVAPLSLGVETQGGIMNVVVPRNTSTPARKDKIYRTVYDNQTSTRIQIFEGERKMTSECHKLGEFELRGLPKMKAGKAEVKVYFDVDSNGILNLTCEDQQNKGNKSQITIVNDKDRLTPAEI